MSTVKQLPLKRPVNDYIEAFEKVVNGMSYPQLAEDFNVSTSRAQQLTRKGLRYVYSRMHQMNDTPPESDDILSLQAIRDAADYWHRAIALHRAVDYTPHERQVSTKVLINLEAFALLKLDLSMLAETSIT